MQNIITRIKKIFFNGKKNIIRSIKLNEIKNAKNG